LRESRSMIRVGLLGTGRIGSLHAESIASHRESTLTAVSDINDETANKLAAQYGAIVKSADEIISDTNIDAILIATSTDTHSDFIEKAAAAGKAILCEKPVDLSLIRAKECLDKVSAAKNPIMVGFNRRFDPNFAQLKKSLDNGEIGNRELLTITSFDPAPPPISYVKTSGGLYRDMMIHDFDLSNFIMGELPISISAVGHSLVDPAIGVAGDVDTAVVTMVYADGKIAVIKNSRRAAYGYDQRIEILGSEGLLQAENILENSVVKSNKDGVISAKPKYFFLERYIGAFKAEWDAFLKSIHNHKPVPVTLKDGVAALAMAEAATQSQNTGKSIQLKELL
jgi:myo-inositol 2-dehydrogenase/D-chiro-inositol 1-dehydrogenase